MKEAETMMLDANLYRNYRTRTFSEIFEDYDTFEDFYTECGIEPTIRHTATQTQSNTLMNLYYLLLARYANSHIASEDESRFGMQVMSIIFQYGPTWEKRLEMQKELRQATEDELLHSSVIYNQADNPETAPSTTDITGIGFVNRQTVNHYIKNKVDAYMSLNAILDTDVTGDFLSKFNKLFNNFAPEIPLWYVTDIPDELINNDDEGDDN